MFTECLPVPGTVVWVLQSLSLLVLIVILQDKDCFYHHVTDEEIKTQEGLITCPTIHG
jgi:hypothetical protein